MTRKEAVAILQNMEYELSNQVDSTYCRNKYDAIRIAIKALEQENVLDEMFENIKTEIDFIPTYGAKFADGSINVHVNKKDVLQIIDKYRGE